jgi:DNA (cytosine-5)-methyltransferase 1
VAQRRRRVFVVASARDDINPIEILFESEGVRRDTAPSRETRESVAASFRPGVAEICPTIGCELAKQVNNQMVGNAEAFYIPEPIAFPSTLSGTQYASAKDVAPSMGAKNPTAVALPIPIHDQATRHAGKNGDKTMGKGNGLGIGQPGDPMNTLTKGDSHAVAYNISPGKGEVKDDIHVTDAHVSKTIDASASNPAMHQGGSAIVQAMAVRRLTPVECERLQGFPDNYSNIPWRKAAESPDGPRYKALGNSWAVPVVAWIGKRIQDQLK